MPTIRPRKLSSCARAATAAEARFRMVGSTPSPRRSRIVALDEHAADVVRRVAAGHLGDARFLTHRPGTPIATANGGAGVVLAGEDGDPVDLDDELDEADMIVLVASTDDGAAAASTIGDAATRRGIMTSGLVLSGGRSAGAAIRALRPHARVLLRSEDEDDLPDVLTALRA
jgi:hypothetical protein